MTLLSDIEGFERGDADVPEGVIIEPPQAYVDNVEATIRAMTHWDGFIGTALDLSDKGITEFNLFAGPSGAGITLPNNVTFDLSLNLFSDLAVQNLFSDIATGLDSLGSIGWQIYTHGPSMGTPLTGGTVGGWTFEILPGYVVGGFGGILISAGGFSASARQIFFDPGIDYVDSNYDANYITIGVMDVPTIPQILQKIADLYSIVNPIGTHSVVGNVLTYADVVARNWLTENTDSDPNFVVSDSGVDPSSADLNYLVGVASCNGSFMAPDGTTQINF